MAELKEARVPDIGDYDDVPVIELLVAVGDTVKQDQGLVTLESDKATMEVPAPFAGVVREIKVKIGDELSEGSVVALIEAGRGRRSAEPGRSPPRRPRRAEPPRAEPAAPSQQVKAAETGTKVEPVVVRAAGRPHRPGLDRRRSVRAPTPKRCRRARRRWPSTPTS